MGGALKACFGASSGDLRGPLGQRSIRRRILTGSDALSIGVYDLTTGSYIYALHLSRRYDDSGGGQRL